MDLGSFPTLRANTNTGATCTFAESVEWFQLKRGTRLAGRAIRVVVGFASRVPAWPSKWLDRVCEQHVSCEHLAGCQAHASTQGWQEQPAGGLWCLRKFACPVL